MSFVNKVIKKKWLEWSDWNEWSHVNSFVQSHVLAYTKYKVDKLNRVQRRLFDHVNVIFHIKLFKCRHKRRKWRRGQISPRLTRCIFLLLKLRCFYFGAENGKKTPWGIIACRTRGHEATKSYLVLRFFWFAKVNLKFAKKKLKPNHDASTTTQCLIDGTSWQT